MGQINENKEKRFDVFKAFKSLSESIDNTDSKIESDVVKPETPTVSIESLKKAFGIKK